MWLRRWVAHDYGCWCVRETRTGRIMGYCGMNRMHINGWPARSLIARFHPDVWGLEYVTEAVMAALICAGTHSGDGSVVARMRPVNLASRNVALKLCLRRDPGRDERGPDGIDEYSVTVRRDDRCSRRRSAIEGEIKLSRRCSLFSRM